MDLCERQPSVHARHPWEIARVANVRRILATASKAAEPLWVLDVGCGDGYVSRQLFGDRPKVRLVGLDSALTAADIAELGQHYPGAAYVASEAELPGHPFDLVLLLHVLEHVEDDHGFLAQLVASRLAPGGWALLAVPAFQALFSAHDHHLRHYRRYRLGQLMALAEGAGLLVRRAGYAFGSLLLPRALSVMVQRLSNAAPHNLGIGGWQGGPAVTAALAGLLDLDNRLSWALSSLGLRLPGLEAWALCQRPA